MYPEALPLLPYEVLRRDLHVVEEQLVGVAVERHLDGVDLQAVARLTHVHDEHGEALRFVRQLLVGRGCARAGA